MIGLSASSTAATLTPKGLADKPLPSTQSSSRCMTCSYHYMPRWCSGGLRASSPRPVHSCRHAHAFALSATASIVDTETTSQHVLSIFVTDEAGLINQVTQVFSEAGMNIDSLAVGLNVDTALFTITVTCTNSGAADMSAKVSALPKVLYVEDLTAEDRVERELVLIKVRASTADGRTEITQLARIYGASILDASENYLTLVATGSGPKTEALQLNLRSKGIVQLCRTGKVSLKRGDKLLDVTATVTASFDEQQTGNSSPTFRLPHDSTADSSTAEMPFDAALENSSSRSNGANLNGVNSKQALAAPDFSAMLSNSNELWQAKQAIGEDGTVLGVLKDSHTLSIEVVDEFGTLFEVTKASNDINVQSLAVGSSEAPGRSRITMVIPRDDEGLPALIQKLSDVPYVGSIGDLTNAPFVARELMLVKVQCKPTERGTVKDIADIFHGKIIDVSFQTMTLELQGREDKMIAAQELLEEFNILEVARTGRVALSRESGINTSLLSRVRGEVSWRKQSAAQSGQ